MTTTVSDVDRHPVDRRPPALQLVVGGVQHVAAMYAGVVAPPLIIGAAVGLSPGQLSLLISASLFTAGLATLLQTLGVWRFGARLPLVNGVTFANVAPVLAIVQQHGPRNALGIVYGATLVGAALIVLAAPFFSRLTRFFPPVVTGTVITLIGVSLLPVAVKWISNQQDSVTPSGLLLAGITLVAVLAFTRFLSGFWSRISLLLGLVVGTLVAWPLGEVDSSTLREAPVFGIASPFHFGTPAFELASIVSMAIVMLVIMAESTADMLALGEVVGRPTTQTTLANGLRADGLATAVSTLFGGFACTAFAQNIGLVALTRMVSRYVVAASGAVLVLLGVFPVTGGIVALVPQPVLGGAGLVLFGSVAVSGVRTLTKASFDRPVNVTIVAAALGVGIIPIAAPNFYTHFPSAVQTVLDSGISAGCVVAVVLNLVFGQRERTPAAV
ncbi:purine permease [Amycolatopsis acidiphila]|uniref:Purine permease n=1 Tax=Amycolatopsis acidiphila TaxID=715473 RepID=A0A558A358_9PSEU|nr:nucleobase:cation symporter-2 family protein [Amycolatopsis acidiphila]TVT18693.1 purine permease [Amycolatopsis acidiphila]UIJ61569.1 purine permease [Amycolatopsis acidiphila]GHG59167.1 permease [Amycolatopsis acidiphila]